jgi:hypothetical protein
MQHLVKKGISGIGIVSGLYYLSQNDNSKKLIVHTRKVGCREFHSYDFYFKDLKKFKYFDRRKLKCKLKSREEHIKQLKNPAAVFDVLIIGIKISSFV